MATKKRIDSKDLVHISDAPQLLGEGWSRSSIERKIKNEELLEGIHFVDESSTSSKKRIIKLVIPEIEKLRSVPAHQR